VRQQKKIMYPTIAFIGIATLSGLVGFGMTRQHPTVAHAANDSLSQPTTLSAVEQLATFHVAVPNLSGVEHQNSKINQLGTNQQVELNYLTKTGMGVTIKETPTKITHEPDSNVAVTNVSLPNGLTAQLEDNGIYKMLFWYKDGISYELFVTDFSTNHQGDSKTISLNNIESIANSIK